MSTEVERKAEALLSEHGVESPPVPVDDLAKVVGLEIVYERFNGDDVSGMLFRDGRRAPTIIVNSTDARVRQRFTVAHELGHFVLEHADQFYVSSTVRVSFRDRQSAMATKVDEMQANQFAASLLMPRAFVDHGVNALLERDPDLDDESLTRCLAARFDVSASAMQYRLINLGYLGAI